MKAVIAGIDEAGRGALAGPVVAAACIIPFELFPRRKPVSGWSFFKRRNASDCIIADSKQLLPEERERAFGWIMRSCAFGIGIVSHRVVEEEGIKAATHRAMQRALQRLRFLRSVDRLLIDGCDHFRFDIPSREIIRGDTLEPAIAAASIIAKVTRDGIMVRHHRLTPLFNFARNKGYGTEEHRNLILRHGPCAFHRRSFLSRIQEMPG